MSFLRILSSSFLEISSGKSQESILRAKNISSGYDSGNHYSFPSTYDQVEAKTKQIEADGMSNNRESNNHNNINNNETNDIPVQSGPRSLWMSTFNVWMYGLTTVVGGQLYGWNAGLVTGFGGWTLAQALTGLSYVVLLCCVSEIQSTVPFSGGSYGLAQIVIGFYGGFMCGCFELVEYLFFCASAVSYLSGVIVSPQFLNIDNSYQFLIWAIFFIFSVITILPSERVFWMTSFLLGGFSFAVILIFCFGSLQFVNFEKYAPLYSNQDDYYPNDRSGTISWFSGGFSVWFSTLSYTTWAYAGIEVLPTLTNYVKEPKRTIPIGAMISIFTLMATNIALVFICSSLAPGLAITTNALFVLSQGFQQLFHLSDLFIAAMILPGQVAMSWAFILPAGRVLHSLAQTNLIPSWWGLKEQKNHTRAVFICCFACYILCVISYYNSNFLIGLQNIAIISAILPYLCQFAVFYKIRTKYATVERLFTSPIPMIVVGITFIFYLMIFVAVSFFNNDDDLAITSLAVISGVLTIYYFLFVKGHQELSSEEERLYFKLNIIKFNDRLREAIQRKGRKQLTIHFDLVDALKIIGSRTTSVVIPKSSQVSRNGSFVIPRSAVVSQNGPDVECG